MLTTSPVIEGVYPADHPVSVARLADVARRSIRERHEVPPPYFQARPTCWDASLSRRPNVALVAVCPDGKIEHYRSIVEAGQAMEISPQNLLHCVNTTRTSRDRKWYRLSTWQQLGN